MCKQEESLGYSGRFCIYEDSASCRPLPVGASCKGSPAIRAATVQQPE